VIIMSSFETVMALITRLSADSSMPNNVRFSLEKVRGLLEDDEKEPAVRLDTAIQIVEGLSLDPNLPSYARTQIWNLTSLLEAATKSP